jgi:hypothetical protein
VTGVKTFIVSHDGIVYEKDLGEKTLELFRDMERYNRDSPGSRCRTSARQVTAPRSSTVPHDDDVAEPTRVFIREGAVTRDNFVRADTDCISENCADGASRRSAQAKRPDIDKQDESGG